MARLLVLIILVVCLGSAGKVALLRFKKKPAVTKKASVWEADGRLRAYPTGLLSDQPNRVFSPYQSNTLLNVSGFQPGELVLCGATQRPFYVPLRHDLDYGEIVGDWSIQRFDRQGPVEYRVRFLAGLSGITGHGRRVKTHGRTLPRAEQSSIDLTGVFSNSHLICTYEEKVSIEKPERGRFEWAFSSAQDALHGVVESPFGLIDSQGRRLTASRGGIAASGKNAKSFLPKGWTMVDQLSGRLNKRGDQFLAMVMDESGELPQRWLVLAHRIKPAGDYQSIIISPHACRQHLGNGEGDPFQGLTLPFNTNREGIIGVRHHASRDYEHAGLDLWFQFDPVSKEWRLSEGRRYKFDLTDPGKSLDWFSVIPGVSLASFNVEAVEYEASFGLAPTMTAN